jgi:hypothetical protein
MKKLIALAIAMLFVIPALVSADDKFKIGGSYELFAYKMENYNDFDDNNDADDQSYFYQRFRVTNMIKPADDITAYFRFDIEEGMWGGPFNGLPCARGNVYGPGGGSGIHYDYAWVKVDKEMYSLQVGMQYFGLGYSFNEVIAQGIRANLKLAPATVSLMYSKVDEGPTNDANDDTGNEDTDFYALQASMAGEGYNAGAFYALIDNGFADTDMWVFGLYGDAALGAINLTAELNFFGGDANATQEWEGTQLFVQAKTNISDAWMVGAQVLWAQGTDDPTERQASTIGDLGSQKPYSYGFIETWDVMYVDAFDPFESDAGVQAIQFITDYQASDVLLLQGALAYAQPEEDNATVVDSAVVLNLSFAYTLATNTKVGLQYNMLMPDTEAGFNDDTAWALFGRFTVSF